jgi:lysosomal alpha-mannosidase
MGISLYESPIGFNWDRHNNSWVLPAVTPDNVALLAAGAVIDMQFFAARSQSNNLLWPIGGDFAFQNAPETFGNWTLLQNYINADPTLSQSLTMKWATVSEYFEAQLNLTGTPYPDLQPGTDFVPYDFLDMWAFWSGFFASRPVLKGQIRYLHGELQSTERLFTLAKTLYPKCVCVHPAWCLCSRKFG